MKLTCTVELKNRMQPNVKRNPLKSTLAIGKETKTEDLFIMYFSTSNSVGTKYKVKDNIGQVFTKFVNEGKATMRFKEPPHDLLIQSDAVQLKTFLRTFKMALERKVSLKDLRLSTLAVTPVPVKNHPLTKLVIKHRSDFPRNGLPRTLEILHMNNISRCSLDKQILYLKNLRVLNISDNCITELPAEIKTLSLSELVLANNRLGTVPSKMWKWFGGRLTHSLKLLDLSNNEIIYINEDIVNFKKLVTLKLTDNKLIHLPSSVGLIPNIKYIYLSRNNLSYLPSTLGKKRLEYLDISENPFNEDLYFVYKEDIQFASLLQVAAKTVLKNKISYDAQTIPYTLVSYLNKMNYCEFCSDITFDLSMSFLNTFNGHLVKEFVSSSTTPKVKCYYCSSKCLNAVHRVIMI